MSGLQRELAAAIELGAKAGEIIAPLFRQNIQVDRKARDEPVTEADRGSEALILGELRRAFPADGILSEEQGDLSSWLERKRVWVVDPLDGTKDFVAGRDGFSVMIGLLIDGRPALGVVRQPLAGLTYHAVAGGGAFLVRDGQQAVAMTPSTVDDPARARLVTSYSHRSDQLDRVRDELGITDELNVGSVGLKVGLVARGDRDLYINPEGHCRLWDICAPEAILVEAGGQMTDIYGRALQYALDSKGGVQVEHGIIASNGACHEAVIQRLGPVFGEANNR